MEQINIKKEVKYLESLFSKKLRQNLAMPDDHNNILLE